ncbi:MAG: hypothetical protein ABEI86_10750, partial [Halobacteriaceae archaeon]
KTKKEWNYYLDLKLWSFERALKNYGAARSLGPYYRKANFEMSRKIALKFALSKLTQEGYVLSKQREFIRNNFADIKAKALIDRINYKGAVDKYLKTGQISKCLAENRIHALADWLYQQAQETWTVDISSIAFQFVRETEWMGRPGDLDRVQDVGPIYADDILFVAAFTNEKQVQECDSIDEERELLRNNVQKWATTHYPTSTGDRIQAQLGLDVGRKSIKLLRSLLPQWLINQPILGNVHSSSIKIDADGTFVETTLENELDRLLDEQRHYLTPIYARTISEYADGQEYPEFPLIRLLDSLSSVYDPTQDKRELYIHEKEYEWAHDTDLLDLAIELYELRHTAFTPLVQFFYQRIGYSPRDLLQMIEQEEAPTPENHPYRIDDVDSNEFEALLEDVILALRQRKQNVYKQIDEEASLLGPERLIAPLIEKMAWYGYDIYINHRMDEVKFTDINRFEYLALRSFLDETDGPY